MTDVIEQNYFATFTCVCIDVEPIALNLIDEQIATYRMIRIVSLGIVSEIHIPTGKSLLACRVLIAVLISSMILNIIQTS